MSLPALTADGVLPSGKHPGDLADIHERFVSAAPDRAVREDAFASLRVFHHVARRIVRTGSLWVGGNFTSLHTDRPDSIDVLIVPDDWEQLAAAPPQEQEKLCGLLTMRDIVVGAPLYIGINELKPVSGEVDAYLCFPGQEDVWHDDWSAKDADPASSSSDKGYVEVSL